MRVFAKVFSIILIVLLSFVLVSVSDAQDEIMQRGLIYFFFLIGIYIALRSVENLISQKELKITNMEKLLKYSLPVLAPIGWDYIALGGLNGFQYLVLILVFFSLIWFEVAWTEDLKEIKSLTDEAMILGEGEKKADFIFVYAALMVLLLLPTIFNFI